MTTAGTDVIPTLIGEIVSLDEEIARVSKPLTERREQARKLLKDAMTEADTREAVDEVSGYKAVIRDTHTDTYVAEKLLPLLPRPELADEVIDTVVNAAKVKELVDAGILTRSRLEQEGALIRKVRARQLLLEPLKGARP